MPDEKSAPKNEQPASLARMLELADRSIEVGVVVLIDLSGDDEFDRFDAQGTVASARLEILVLER